MAKRVIRDGVIEMTIALRPHVVWLLGEEAHSYGISDEEVAASLLSAALNRLRPSDDEMTKRYMAALEAVGEGI